MSSNSKGAALCDALTMTLASVLAQLVAFGLRRDRREALDLVAPERGHAARGPALSVHAGQLTAAGAALGPEVCLVDGLRRADRVGDDVEARQLVNREVGRRSVFDAGARDAGAVTE